MAWESKNVKNKNENEQITKGFVFDIDGTLVDKNKSEISPNIVNRMLATLRLNRPVVVATGRGLGSVEEMILNKVLPHMKGEEIQDLLSKFFIATHNGSQIYSVKVEDGQLETEKIVENKLEQSTEIFEAIKSKYSPLLVLDGNGFKSKAKDTSVVLSFKDGVKTPSAVEVSNFLFDQGFKGFKVLEPGKNKLDVVSFQSGKQKAIEILAERGYLSEPDVARFGDQGRTGGNDEEMLAHDLGFEVTNPEDTESKLNSLKLHHDIVLAKEDFENGNPQLLNQYIATAEKARANFSFGSEKNKNEVLKNAYYNPEFIDQLKFSFTGALAFNEAELKQMKADSAFSSFINAKSDIAKDKSKYFLEYGGTNYSRAEGFYSTEKKAVGIENPLERFNLLSANIKELLFFLNKIEKFIFSEQNNLTSVEWKLSIAFYDNLKSNLLHLFHAFSYLKTQGFVEDNELNNKLNEELRKSVEGVVGNYFDLINLQSPKVFYSDSLNNLVDQASIAVEQALEKGVESKAVSKSIRGIMEADSPAQVNIFANNIAEEIVSEHPNRKIVLIGLHFGGAELPYAIQSALKRRNSDVNVEIVSAHYSNYSNKDARFNNGYFDKQLDLTDSDVFLLDDGVFTGGSLAKVVDELARFGANVLPRTMQVGNSRRLGHMQKSGGVNPSFLETQIVRNAVGITPSARAMTKEKFEQLEAEDKFNLMQMRVSQMTKAYYTKEEK